MNARRLRGAAMAALLVALAACAPLPLRTTPGTAGELAAQTAREQALAGVTRFTLEGRIGVSDGQDGGSGGFTWKQDGAALDFTVRAPITGRSFRLETGPDGACLRGLKPQPLCAADAESLLVAQLGWHLPLADLRAWAMGLRAPDSAAQLAFGPDGLPAILDQDGWHVEYRDWDRARSPAMPRAIFARKPPYSVRLYVEHWELP